MCQPLSEASQTHHLRTSYIPDLILHTNSAGRRMQNGFAHPIQFLWFHLHHKSEAVPRIDFKKREGGFFKRGIFVCIYEWNLAGIYASFGCIFFLCTIPWNICFFLTKLLIQAPWPKISDEAWCRFFLKKKRKRKEGRKIRKKLKSWKRYRQSSTFCC